MTRADTARSRVDPLSISRPGATSAAELVGSLCALQRQDYAGALSAIGLRLHGSTREDIARSISSRAIVRGWPIRRTLHSVASRDIDRMLGLLAARIVAGAVGPYRQLKLTEADFDRSADIVRRALSERERLGRRGLHLRTAYLPVPRSPSAAGETEPRRHYCCARKPTGSAQPR